MRWLALPLLSGLLSGAIAVISPRAVWWAIIFGALCMVPLARRDRYVWVRRVSLVAASWVALTLSIEAGARLYGAVQGPPEFRLIVVTTGAGGLGALLVGIAARVLVPLKIKAKSVVMMVAFGAVAGGVLGLGPSLAFYMGVFLWQLGVGGVRARAHAEDVSPKP